MSKSRPPQKTTDIFEQDSTSIFELLALMKQLLIHQICAMFPYQEMAFRISIQDGSKLYHLQEKYPRVLFKMGIRESVEHQTVLAMYQRENDRDRSYHRLKTMVSRCIYQMIKTRNFRARNERTETGVLVISQKREIVSVERRMGECYQWRANGPVFKRRLFQFQPRK